jgi:hypothetical protein
MKEGTYAVKTREIYNTDLRFCILIIRFSRDFFPLLDRAYRRRAAIFTRHSRHCECREFFFNARAHVVQRPSRFRLRYSAFPENDPSFVHRPHRIVVVVLGFRQTRHRPCNRALSRRC